jgi:cytochrome c oxidase subunit 4
MAANKMKHGAPEFHPGSNQEHFDPSSHVAPISMYVGIWAALMIFTGLTVFAASVELHVFNIVLALVIASIKGTLVVLFFMHLRYSTKLTMVTVVAALFFLFILFSMSMTDYLTRSWLTYPGTH